MKADGVIISKGQELSQDKIINEKGDVEKWFNRNWQFNNDIKEKYSNSFDMNNYVLGCLLSGSTRMNESLPFDIPDESDPNGPGLIEKFIRKTYAGYKQN